MDFKPSHEPVEPIILDPADSEDAEYIQDIEDFRTEVSKKYPTVESAVDAYRKGYVDPSYLSGAFNDEEMAHIRAEGDKKNALELEQRKVELKKAFPTADQAIEAYAGGYLYDDEIKLIFSLEEVKRIQEEGTAKRKQLEDFMKSKGPFANQ
jgi:hypothetical protein